jgi:uncharacterized protein involved in exopolysaccharide biosynthesis
MTDSVANLQIDDARRAARDTIDISAIGKAIWRQKRIFFIVPAVLLVISIIYLHVANYKYEVTYQVIPVSQDVKTGMKNLGALADAAGISLQSTNSGDVDPFELYLQGLYTHDTAGLIASDQNLMHDMFPNEWDADTRSWHDPHPYLHAVAGALRVLLGFPKSQWQAPDAARIETYIRENVTISRDLRNPVVTIQMYHADPAVAIAFLNRLHESEDGTLRQRTLIRTGKYIEYLDNELKKVTYQDYRQALVDLLTDQEKRRMFASSPTISYAAQPFQVPTASQMPSYPSPGVVLTATAFIGLLLGGMLAFFLDAQSGGPAQNSQRRALPR